MIISRTPFRISFAGGGTDLSSFYSTEQGAVISACIDKYMYICVNRRFDNTIRVSYSKTEIVPSVDEIQHPIIKEALKLTGITNGIEITSIADIPSGSGLGSSSSFTVGLLHALYAYQGTYVTPERLAQEACHLEIDILGEPIGKQDQYIVAYGGINHILFNADETVFVDPVVCSKETKKELTENLMMFYTGSTRKASAILTEQKKNTGKKIAHLIKLRDLTIPTKDILTRGTTLTEFGKILHAGWLLKKELVSAISTDSINNNYQKALDSGALGGKLLGAGGGGFLLLYVERQNQTRVRKSLKELREISFSLEPEGSKIIYVGVNAW